MLPQCDVEHAYFLVENNRRTLGLPLVHAAAGDCVRLLDVCDTAPVGNGHTISVHINVSVSNRIHIEQILSLVAWLPQMEYPNHDQEPSRSATHNHTREVGEARRTCGVQVPKGEALGICS
jgi:hypothetical protein